MFGACACCISDLVWPVEFRLLGSMPLRPSANAAPVVAARPSLQQGATVTVISVSLLGHLTQKPGYQPTAPKSSIRIPHSASATRKNAILLNCSQYHAHISHKAF